MTKVMEGVRVLEVAQYTFVPAAGAVLADWGADVIKIEHPTRGDAQRGFIRVGALPIIVANVVTLALAVAILALKWWHGREDPAAEQQQEE